MTSSTKALWLLLLLQGNILTTSFNASSLKGEFSGKLMKETFSHEEENSIPLFSDHAT